MFVPRSQSTQLLFVCNWTINFSVHTHLLRKHRCLSCNKTTTSALRTLITRSVLKGTYCSIVVLSVNTYSQYVFRDTNFDALPLMESLQNNLKGPPKFKG